MNEQPYVYFIPANIKEGIPSSQKKIRSLILESGIFDTMMPGKDAVIKLHFGEEGNKGYVKPEYVRVIVDLIKEKGVDVKLCDTNTLYKGRRTESNEHTALAHEHGFTLENTMAHVLIPGNTPDQVIEVPIDQKYVKTAKVARIFIDCDNLIDVTHFKGHLMTGFGGALKNIGMGCASREGKLEQHGGVSPHVLVENCVACGACVEVCPVDAISINNDKAFVDGEKCIGCASCLAACQYHAMDVQWQAGGSTIQQKMVEYAKAVLDSKKNAAFFINFAVKITGECDCLAKDDPEIVEDIGIFASTDPVSIDKACYDMAVKRAGRDIFKETHPERDGMTQLNYAAEIGLGNLDYKLIELA